MTRQNIIRNAAIVLAVVVLALATSSAAPRPAHAAGPGMSLSGPETVVVGETFTITVYADPAPDVEIAGFATEVVYPSSPETGAECENALDDDGDTLVNDGCVTSGAEPESGSECTNSEDDDGDGLINEGCPAAGALEVIPRSCVEEVQPVRVDGMPLGLCVRTASVLSGGILHSVLSEVVGVPLPALDTSPGSREALIVLEMRCNSPGVHAIVLTAVPESGLGALYGNVQSQGIEVKTISYDVDGDTSPEAVADVITIDCLPCPDCPVPTPAPTPVQSQPLSGPDSVGVSPVGAPQSGGGYSSANTSSPLVYLGFAIAGLSTVGIALALAGNIGLTRRR